MTVTSRMDPVGSREGQGERELRRSAAAEGCVGLADRGARSESITGTEGDLLDEGPDAAGLVGASWLRADDHLYRLAGSGLLGEHYPVGVLELLRGGCRAAGSGAVVRRVKLDDVARTVGLHHPHAGVVAVGNVDGHAVLLCVSRAREHLCPDVGHLHG